MPIHYFTPKFMLSLYIIICFVPVFMDNICALVSENRPYDIFYLACACGTSIRASVPEL